MRIGSVIVLSGALALASSLGCAMQQKKVQEELKSDPAVNCSTAEGDLRMLNAEKAHVAERIVEGAMAITPIGAVVGVVTGTEATKLEVAIGEYNKQLDARIIAIKRTCGL